MSSIRTGTVQIERDAQRITISPQGVFDSDQADLCRAHLVEAFQDGCREALFDFAETTLITSMGLGFLAEAWKLAGPRGARVRIESPSPAVKRLLDRMRLEELFALQHSEEGSGAETMANLSHALAEEIQLLDRMSRTVASILPLRDRAAIVRRLLEGLLEALGAGRGVFYVFRPEPPALTLTDAVGLTPETIEAAGRLPLEAESVEGAAIAGRQCRWTALPGEAPGWSPLMEGLGFESAILAPIVGETGTLGLVVVEASMSGVSRWASAAPLVETHAGLCGLALEKAELLASLEERNRSLEDALLRLGQAQAALNDSGKLAMLGALISGLGHTLNNRLSPILGYAQIFHRKLGADPTLSRQLGALESSARELKHILERLILIARGHAPDFEPGRLNEAIESALAMTEPLLASGGVSVVRCFDEALPEIYFDRQLMIQAFLSIFHRAQHVFPKDALEKRIEIETMRDTAGVSVVVRDNGMELKESSIERLLDPLEPLQWIGREEVFNLSIPASVFQKHGGSLAVEARAGGGATIRIRLPWRPRTAQTPRTIG